MVKLNYCYFPICKLKIISVPNQLKNFKFKGLKLFNFILELQRNLVSSILHNLHNCQYSISRPLCGASNVIIYLNSTNNTTVFILIDK